MNSINENVSSKENMTFLKNLIIKFLESLKQSLTVDNELNYINNSLYNNILTFLVRFPKSEEIIKNILTVSLTLCYNNTQICCNNQIILKIQNIVDKIMKMEINTSRKINSITNLKDCKDKTTFLDSIGEKKTISSDITPVAVSSYEQRQLSKMTKKKFILKKPDNIEKFCEIKFDSLPKKFIGN
jgi:hypothetical protein